MSAGRIYLRNQIIKHTTNITASDMKEKYPFGTSCKGKIARHKVFAMMRSKQN